MRTLLLVALLTLVGCETAPSRVRTVAGPDTPIPVGRKCPDPDKIPAVPQPTKPEGDEAQKAAALGKDTIELQKYALAADALLKGCAR